MAAPNQDIAGENPDGSSYDMAPGSSGDNDGDGDKGGEPVVRLDPLGARRRRTVSVLSVAGVNYVIWDIVDLLPNPVTVGTDLRDGMDALRPG